MLASTCVPHQRRYPTHLFYIVQYFLQLFPDHYKQKKKTTLYGVAFIFCVVWQREKESNLRPNESKSFALPSELPRNKSVARPERIELPYSCYSFDDRLEGGWDTNAVNTNNTRYTYVW